ncbi:MAG: hypothetical protein KBG25_02005 [Paludibacteraceae bacterium]|nr:hypothetical protein [Paludibacteraceae bacterium]
MAKNLSVSPYYNKLIFTELYKEKFLLFDVVSIVRRSLQTTSNKNKKTVQPILSATSN